MKPKGLNWHQQRIQKGIDLCIQNNKPEQAEYNQRLLTATRKAFNEPGALQSIKYHRQSDKAFEYRVVHDDLLYSIQPEPRSRQSEQGEVYGWRTLCLDDTNFSRHNIWSATLAKAQKHARLHTVNQSFDIVYAAFNELRRDDVYGKQYHFITWLMADKNAMHIEINRYTPNDDMQLGGLSIQTSRTFTNIQLPLPLTDVATTRRAIIKAIRLKEGHNDND